MLKCLSFWSRATIIIDLVGVVRGKTYIKVDNNGKNSEVVGEVVRDLRSFRVIVKNKVGVGDINRTL